MKITNTNPRYGDEGPFEAESAEQLADGMMNMFAVWAKESYGQLIIRGMSIDPSAYIEEQIKQMRADYISGLEVESMPLATIQLDGVNRRGQLYWKQGRIWCRDYNGVTIEEPDEFDTGMSCSFSDVIKTIQSAWDFPEWDLKIIKRSTEYHND